MFEVAYDEAVAVDDEYYSQYRSLKEQLRERRITLSERDKKDFADWSDFLRSNFGTLKIVNDGTPVDTVYMELAEEYRSSFPGKHAPRGFDKADSDVCQELIHGGDNYGRYYGDHSDEIRRYARVDLIHHRGRDVRGLVRQALRGGGRRETVVTVCQPRTCGSCGSCTRTRGGCPRRP
jgi:hypothetical protein